VKVVSWNIQFGRDIERAARELTERPALAGAEVLLVQELDEEGAETLARTLGGYEYEYVAASVHPRTGRHFGNAVLASGPLADREVIELPHKARLSGQPRVALKVTTSVDDRTVALCSTHTEIPALGATKRRDQFATLAETASTWPTELAIVGGDFNTMSRRGVRSLAAHFGDAGFAHVSSNAGTTLRRAGRNFTLDHVFARGLVQTASGVVRGTMVGDHAPVWVTLIDPAHGARRRSRPR
jgi:endonuclease/exonuclease/phosphatase family metal-dependent hydrolase